MKKTLLSLVFLIISFSSFCQFYPIHSLDFFQNNLIQCKWDTSITVRGFDKWCVYQTLDSTMFGPIDSSLCINVADSNGFDLNINMDDIDLTKPLYIKYLFDSTNQIYLDSNFVYNIYLPLGGSLFSFGIPLVDTSANCKDGGFCTGVYAAIETPGNTGSGTLTSWYNGGYSVDYIFGQGQLSVCFPTQGITHMNKLKELIIRIQPISISVGKNFRLSFVEIQQPFFINKFSEISTGFLTGTNTYSYDFSPEQNLGLYHDTTFPGVANISYIDVSPVPNVSAISTININVDGTATVHFQPFTQLRGAYVSGSVTDRHNFNLNLINGNICLNGFIELVFWDHNNFIYSGGNLNFYGARGCLLFGNGGKLIVKDNVDFHYSKNQQGLLALLPGGTIELGTNSTMKISNTVVLSDYPGITGESQVYMTLHKGNTLIFEKGSGFENRSLGELMKLNIYMQGGVVDLSGLPKKELKHINLIYQSPYDDDKKNLQIVQNPVKNELFFNYISNTEKEIKIKLFDSAGKLALRSKIKVVKGVNYLSIPVLELKNGMFFIECSSERSSISKKFIKQ